MELKDAIEGRRAYRALGNAEITEEMINEMARAANMAPSCFNNQPWRYVFVTETNVLDKVKEALSQGNAWARNASMIIAVLASKDDDCVIRDREYYLFDTGMATANLILTATDLGLVAHPIAGYSPKKVREVLGIPGEVQVITLLIVGKHEPGSTELMSEGQIEAESERPERQPLSDFVFRNRYNND